jgi:cell division protein FtsB
LYKAEYEEYKSQIKDLKQEIENLKYKNNYLAECALEEQNELNKEIKNLKKDIETLLKHEQEWMSFKDTLEEDKHKALFENRDLKQSIAKYKLDLGLLLQLHCGRCEDPAECPNCGWDFLKEDLGLK